VQIGPVLSGLSHPEWFATYDVDPVALELFDLVWVVGE
jgi:hypothetical protein